MTPQPTDSHIRISIELWEALGRYRLSGEEWLVLNCIIRKTWGWRKKEDKISLSQIEKYTGLIRQNVHRTIQKLSSKKIITVIKNDDSQINSYSFNKYYEEWGTVIKVDDSKKQTVIKNDDTSVIQVDDKTVIQNDEYNNYSTTNTTNTTKVVDDKSSNTIEIEKPLSVEKPLLLGNIPKDLTSTIVDKPVKKKTYGNKDVNEVMQYMKDKLKLETFDGSREKNRFFCSNLIKKFGVDEVKLMIDAAANDKWYKTKVTSFITLFYKGQEIKNSARDSKKNTPTRV